MFCFNFISTDLYFGHNWDVGILELKKKKIFFVLSSMTMGRRRRKWQRRKITGKNRSLNIGCISNSSWNGNTIVSVRYVYDSSLIKHKESMKKITQSWFVVAWSCVWDPYNADQCFAFYAIITNNWYAQSLDILVKPGCLKIETKALGMHACVLMKIGTLVFNGALQQKVPLIWRRTSQALWFRNKA